MDFRIKYLDFSDRANVLNGVKEVLDGEILGCCFRNFLNPKNCSLAVTNSLEHGFFWRKEGVVGRIGANIYQFQDKSFTQSQYFDFVTKFQNLRNWIYQASGDPTNHLVQLFNDAGLEANIFQDPLYGSYSQGVILVQDIATKIHVDSVFHESQDWSISQNAEHQFSSVIILQKDSGGGNIEIFDRQFDPSKDAEFYRIKSEGTRSGVVEDIVNGCQSVTTNLEVGDLFIFPTTYYHRVTGSSGNKHRVSSLCFFGYNTNEPKKVHFFI
jgi:hypothetical protein